MATELTGNKKTDISIVKNEMKKSLDKEIIKEYTRLANIAKKRYQRIENADLYSPAVEGLKKKTDINTIFRRGGKDTQQLAKDMILLKEFVNSDTSTVTGAKNFRKQSEEILGLKNVSRGTLSTIWRAINKAKEVAPVIMNYQALGKRLFNEGWGQYDSTRLYEYVKDNYDSFSYEDTVNIDSAVEDIARKAIDVIGQLYETQSNEIEISLGRGARFK